MDAMRAALKAKRGGGPPMASAPGLMAAGPEQEQGGGMSDLLQGLSHSQKAELMGLLQKDVGSPNKSSAIEKGEPSDEERQAISQEIAAGDEGDDGDVDSDQIAMDMLDSKYKGGLPQAQPRNLGERVKMEMASKLKAKGKI